MCEAFYGYGYTRQLKTETIDSVESHANLVVCRNGKRYIAVDSTE